MSSLSEVVSYLEERKSPFAVSRLIMLSGVQVRRLALEGKEDPEVMWRVGSALRELLTPDELAELRQRLDHPLLDGPASGR